MGFIGTSFRATKEQIGLGNVTNDAQMKRVSSATDNAIVRFDTTDGSVVQDSLLQIDDAGALLNKQIATPTTPAATYNKLYFKSDNNLYKLNSSGVETEITAGKLSSIGTSTDNAVVRWDGALGDTLQNSSLLVDDVGATINPHITTPANPSSGSVKLYFKNDDKLYKLTSGGIESEIGAGGSDNFTVKASSGDASPNYLDGKVAKSIVVTSDKLELSGDSASPGNNKVYGTNNSGTKGFYDSLITGVKLQAVTDGGMQVTQLQGGSGVATNPSSGGYPVMDMWKVEYVTGAGSLPANILHSQQSIGPGILSDTWYCYRINPDGAGTVGATTYYRIGHYIYQGTRNLAGSGNSVTLRINALHTITGTKRLGIRLIQNYGTGGSPTADEVITGSTITVNPSTYTEQYIIFTLNTISGKTFGTNNDDYIKIEIYYMWGSDYNTSLGTGSTETFIGSGLIHIAKLQLNIGTYSLPYPVEDQYEAIEKCKRWYQKSYNYETSGGAATTVGFFGLLTGTATTSTMGIDIQFHPSFVRTPASMFFDNLGAFGKCFKGAAGKSTQDAYLGKSSARCQTVDVTSAIEMSVHYVYDCRY